MLCEVAAPLLLGARGFFGRGGRAVSREVMREGAESAVNWSAHNAASATRLKTTLALREANILDESGRLTEYALGTAELALRKGTILRNPSVVEALTKNGSNIADWEKLTTRSINMPTGQRIQVHFYRNSVTGEVNYSHPDFKVKNPVDIFSPNPGLEPTIRPPYNRP